MNNKIYELFNHAHIDLTEYEQQPLSAGEKDKIKSRFLNEIADMDKKKKPLFRKSFAAACMAAAVLVAGTLSAVASGIIPPISDLFRSDLLQMDSESSKWADETGKYLEISKVSKDIKLTAKAVIGDKNNCAVLFDLEKADGSDLEDWMQDTRIVSFDSVDAVVLGADGAGSSGQYFKKNDGDKKKIQFIVECSSTEEIRNKWMYVTIHGLGYCDPQKDGEFVPAINGKWRFFFTLDYEDSTMELASEEVLQVQGKEIRISSLQISPLGYCMIYSLWDGTTGNTNIVDDVSILLILKNGEKIDLKHRTSGWCAYEDHMECTQTGIFDRLILFEEMSEVSIGKREFNISK